MDGLQARTARNGHRRPIARQGAVIEIDSIRRRVEDRPLRCVSSGYLSDGCSCHATIPAAVANAAWARELGRDAARGDRFFHFASRGQVWLAFGLASGEIRGAYCPAHRVERDAHATGFSLAQHAHTHSRLEAI